MNTITEKYLDQRYENELNEGVMDYVNSLAEKYQRYLIRWEQRKKKALLRYRIVTAKRKKKIIKLARRSAKILAKNLSGKSKGSMISAFRKVFELAGKTIYKELKSVRYENTDANVSKQIFQGLLLSATVVLSLIFMRTFLFDFITNSVANTFNISVGGGIVGRATTYVIEGIKGLVNFTIAFIFAPFIKETANWAALDRGYGVAYNTSLWFLEGVIGVVNMMKNAASKTASFIGNLIKGAQVVVVNGLVRIINTAVQATSSFLQMGSFGLAITTAISSVWGFYMSSISKGIAEEAEEDAKNIELQGPPVYDPESLSRGVSTVKNAVTAAKIMGHLDRGFEKIADTTKSVKDFVAADTPSGISKQVRFLLDPIGDIKRPDSAGMDLFKKSIRGLGSRFKSALKDMGPSIEEQKRNARLQPSSRF